MSHFTVLVIGPDPDSQLAPFHEFECTGVDDEYVQDIDVTDEVMEQYEEQKGMFSSPLDTAESTYGLYPKGSKDEHGEPVSEKYGFVELNDDGTLKRAIRRNNPNKKWDWYQLGGRWRGYFKSKNTIGTQVGEASLVHPIQPEENYVDQLTLGNLDLEGMREDAKREAAVYFDKVMKVINGRSFPTWTEVRKKYSEDDIDKARDEYHEHPVISDLKKENLLPWSTEIKEALCGLDREKYLQRRADGVLTTHAVIKDGKWIENGEMLMFGIAKDKMDPDVWNREFNKLLEGLPKETMLSLYDCHI